MDIFSSVILEHVEGCSCKDGAYTSSWTIFFFLHSIAIWLRHLKSFCNLLLYVFTIAQHSSDVGALNCDYGAGIMVVH
jgi:hypothetical protein